jgi:hypothetical protein
LIRLALLGKRVSRATTTSWVHKHPYPRSLNLKAALPQSQTLPIMPGAGAAVTFTVLPRKPKVPRPTRPRAQPAGRRLSQNFKQAIRAELIGSNACSALGITARGHAPVLALCQLLIEAGHDPDRPLLAYRGDTLCLRVRSIAEGAALAVEDDRRGTPRFRRRRARGDGAAPYVAQIRKARV